MTIPSAEICGICPLFEASICGTWVAGSLVPPLSVSQQLSAAAFLKRVESCWKGLRFELSRGLEASTGELWVSVRMRRRYNSY
jgi:hypothetical protein